MDIISVADLTSYLGLAAGSLDSNTRAGSIVTRTNAKVTEKWVNPTDPAPTDVIDVALAVAANAYGITPGRGQLESITRSADNTSRTERYRVPAGSVTGADVYLTDEQLAVLRGGRSRRRRTIRTHVPGERYC